MCNPLIPIAAIVGLFLVGGCQGAAPVKADGPAAEAAKPAEPMLTEDAAQALTKAEADVKAAKAQKSLWTTADDALRKAQDAAAKGNGTAVLKFSKIASDQARLGLEQKNYPSTK